MWVWAIGRSFGVAADFAAPYYDVLAIEQPLLVRMRSEPGPTCIAFSSS